ncbi:MAG: alanine--glyoxylate aminotransferase family protein [Anaerolineae bacterium]|nr:alanine--glyoxylate aminotransferase family protein [Anaerolineae bacterium]
MQYKLFIPGPCEVDEAVLSAMAQQTRPHYGAEWLEVHREVSSLLRQIFETENDIFLVPGAGSALLDMALGSMLATGETVIVGDNGFFGSRLQAMARGYGLRVVSLLAEHGHPLDPDDLRRLLAREPAARAVAVIHHETATTVLNPLQELAAVTHEAGLPIIVDAISSLGGVSLPVDAWGIDVCVSVANKCLECPPGVAFISVGPRAWEWVDGHENQHHGWYLDLRTWRQYATEWADWHPSPVTMPTNNILGLRVSLRNIVGKGLENHFAHFRQAAHAVRQGLGAMGFAQMVAEPYASPIATAFKARPEFAVKELIDYLAQSQGILVSGGLGPLAGRVFRVGHMGKAATPPYIKEFLSAVALFMRQRGFEFSEADVYSGLVEKV